MEEMIEGLMAKVGLSKEKAEQVVEFVKDNASKLPEWLGKSDMVKDIASKIPGLGGLAH